MNFFSNDASLKLCWIWFAFFLSDLMEKNVYKNNPATVMDQDGLNKLNKPKGKVSEQFTRPHLISILNSHYHLYEDICIQIKKSLLISIT